MSVHRYAEALFDLALENEQIDDLSSVIDRFYQEAGSSLIWTKMMDAPIRTDGEKIRIIDDLGLDPSFSAFLKVLVKHRHMHKFKDIYEAWLHLARRHQKIAHVALYTATSLSEQHIEKIRAVLAPRFKHQTITFSVTVDHNLIGGLKVIHNGQSVDLTIARELQELENSI